MKAELLLEAYLNSSLFPIKYEPNIIGRIIKSNIPIEKYIVETIDTDLLTYLREFFDFDNADSITMNMFTKHLYGNKSGLYYLFMSLYLSAYRLRKNEVPPVEFYKYNVGVDIAWLFWPNVADHLYNTTATIKRMYYENTLISSFRMIHPFLIDELSQYVNPRKDILLKPSQVVFNLVAKYDTALAIAFVVSALTYKLLSEKGIKVSGIYDTYSLM